MNKLNMITNILVYVSGVFKIVLLYALRILSLLPLKIRYRVTDVFSFVIFLLCTQKRIAVSQNLKLIEGRKPSLKENLRVFTEYGKYWAELFDVQSLWYNSEINDPEFLPKKGPFLGLTFHTGNFEFFGPAIYSVTGNNFYVIAERLRPLFLSDFFKKCRLRHHIETIFHDDIREIVKRLNSNQSLGIVCDRIVGGRGIETRLFGKRVRLPLNLLENALQKKIPIIVSYCLKEGQTFRFYSYKISSNAHLEEAISIVVKILEDAIRKDPYQWHVLSRI